MREIKFRAWDKSKNTFINYNVLCFSKEGFGYAKPLGYSNMSNPDNLEIIQYTGLKDKNGKEIYEGDIVKINDKLYTVTYEIGSFMLVKCSEETDMYEEFKNCWNDNVYPLSQLYWENDCEEDCIYQLEIVGNIYENKDLLE